MPSWLLSLRPQNLCARCPQSHYYEPLKAASEGSGALGRLLSDQDFKLIFSSFHSLISFQVTSHLS